MSTPRYPCGRCGKRDRADRMVYSRFTHARYCRDMGACAQRAKRKEKGAA